MFADDDKSQVSDSPAKEVARAQAATDRTSRMLFQLEAQIRERFKKVIVPFLMRPASEIECLLFGRNISPKPIMLPLRNKHGTYGFYLPPGLDNEIWPHPNPSYQDLVEYPRIIVSPYIGGTDLPLNQDELMESLLVEQNGRIIPREERRYGFVRFTESRLMIMLALSPSLELLTDWSDIATVHSSSFTARLAPLRYSCNELFQQPTGIIGRFASADVHEAKTQRISARIERPY